MKKLIIGSLLVLCFIAISITSFIFIKNKREDKNQEIVFKELQENIETKDKEDDKIIINEQVLQGVPEFIEIEINDTEQNKSSEIDLLSVYMQNQDLVGWIKIDGTSINYPVMQNETYYLRKNFYKSYSRYGTPFLAEYCDIKDSDNLVIYGHNIRNGNMFSDLIKYRKENYFKNHNIIKLYELQEEITMQREYEIISVFEISLDDDFKYYSCYNFKIRDDFDYFYENIKNLSIYDTGNNADFGDKFITLSTCNYSLNNGRMVIIAKEIR